MYSTEQETHKERNVIRILILKTSYSEFHQKRVFSGKNDSEGRHSDGFLGEMHLYLVKCANTARRLDRCDFKSGFFQIPLFKKRFNLTFQSDQSVSFGGERGRATASV